MIACGNNDESFDAKMGFAATVYELRPTANGCDLYFYDQAHPAGEMKATLNECSSNIVVSSDGAKFIAENRLISTCTGEQELLPKHTKSSTPGNRFRFDSAHNIWSTVSTPQGTPNYFEGLTIYPKQRVSHSVLTNGGWVQVAEKSVEGQRPFGIPDSRISFDKHTFMDGSLHLSLGIGLAEGSLFPQANPIFGQEHLSQDREQILIFEKVSGLNRSIEEGIVGGWAINPGPPAIAFAVDSQEIAWFPSESILPLVKRGKDEWVQLEHYPISQHKNVIIGRHSKTGKIEVVNLLSGETLISMPSQKGHTALGFWPTQPHCDAQSKPIKMQRSLRDQMPLWVIIAGANKNKYKAEAQVRRMQSFGLSGDYFWLPDYPETTSGKPFWIPFSGPLHSGASKTEVEQYLRKVQQVVPSAYALKLASDGLREEIR